VILGRVFIIGGHWPKSLHWFNPDAEEVEVNPTMCTHVIRENVSALAHRGTFVLDYYHKLVWKPIEKLETF